MIDKILKSRKNFLITGGAGTGKSHLLRQIASALRNQNKKVAVLGSTGIAAVNVGGQTIHSFFGFGVCGSIDELALKDRRNRSRLKNILTTLGKLDAIMIDEVSMVSASLAEMIAYRLRHSDFCGRIFFAGDFYQLPPVEKREERSDSLFAARYAFESEAWREFAPEFIELDIPHRSHDREFLDLLNALRVGILDEKGERLLERYAAQNYVLQNDPTRLYGVNARADSYNEFRLRQIPAKEHIFEAEVEISKAANEQMVEKFVKNLNTPFSLRLKVGAPLLFTVNEAGKYYNGERGTIEEIGEESLIVRKADGERVLVERHSFAMEEQGEAEPKILASVEQFPVRLAWAITIHKSQGMGIGDLAVDLDNLFEAGQFYVAISRAIDPSRLYLQSARDPIAKIRRAISPNSAVDRFYENERGKTRD